MRFYIEFEMEKHHCMNCPMCDLDDMCNLQREDGIDTLEQQMANCPLEEAGCDYD
jgi:hypothetical protein